MKINFRAGISIILLMVVTLACGGTAVTSIAPTEGPANAINTAVAGTQQSQALAQATVNSTTLTAMPAPATPTPGPTVEYVALTEEELAALIDEAVDEAGLPRPSKPPPQSRPPQPMTRLLRKKSFMYMTITTTPIIMWNMPRNCSQNITHSMQTSPQK